MSIWSLNFHLNFFPVLLSLRGLAVLKKIFMKFGLLAASALVIAASLLSWRAQIVYEKRPATRATCCFNNSVC